MSRKLKMFTSLGLQIPCLRIHTRDIFIHGQRETWPRTYSVAVFVIIKNIHRQEKGCIVVKFR